MHAMPNPLFNESTMKKAPATWAPPEPGTEYIPPITDGPQAARNSTRATIARMAPHGWQ